MKKNTEKNYYKALIETPLGQMIAIAVDDALYWLDFEDSRAVDLKLTIISGRTAVLDSIERELNQYFEGKLKEFKTPIQFVGTPFQIRVWTALQGIAYAETQSYAGIAKSINHPTAYRAVAQANSVNKLAVIVPCHRVINSDGKLGGYNGGLSRKEWLLKHEQQTS